MKNDHLNKHPRRTALSKIHLDGAEPSLVSLTEGCLTATYDIPRTKATEAVAASEGLSFDAWIRWRLTAIDEDLVTFLDYVQTLKGVTAASEILVNAFEGSDWEVWGVPPRTVKDFREDMKMFTTPDPPWVTEADCRIIQQVGDASLALDGQLARRLAQSLVRRWRKRKADGE